MSTRAWRAKERRKADKELSGLLLEESIEKVVDQANIIEEVVNQASRHDGFKRRWFCEEVDNSNLSDYTAEPTSSVLHLNDDSHVFSLEESAVPSTSREKEYPVDNCRYRYQPLEKVSCHGCDASAAFQNGSAEETGSYDSLESEAEDAQIDRIESVQHLITEDADRLELKALMEEVEEKSIGESLSKELAGWAIQYNQRSTAVTALLKILRKYNHPDLPMSSLLKTPRTTVDTIKDFSCRGKFWYYGIFASMTSRLTSTYLSRVTDGHITIDVFIDGLAPYKSVKKQIWPIAGCLVGTKIPFVIAAWCGETRDPPSLNSFLEDFVQEANELIEKGFNFQGKTYKLRIRNYLADAPARAWLKCVKQHNNKICCERCTVKAHWELNRMVYRPDDEFTLRTDESFLSQEQKDYHVGESPLLKLHVNMISQVPLDPMHLLYLGVVRRILGRLLERKKSKCTLTKAEIEELTKITLAFAHHTPSEFNRKPRALKEWKMFKATELRRILLYDGFILFKKYDDIPNYSLIFCY